MVKKFATGMHESWLYNPTTSTKLSILSWQSCLWILKFSHPFILQFLIILRPTRTWKDGKIITVLVLLRMALMEEVLIIPTKYDEKLTRTDEGPAPKIIGCTPGAEARQHVGFQEITVDNLFKHGEALTHSSGWWIRQIFWRQLGSLTRTKWKWPRFSWKM